MAAITFWCVACGKASKVNIPGIPPGGVKGACPFCGSAIRIYPDGRLEGATPTAPAPSGPASAQPEGPPPPIPPAEPPPPPVQLPPPANTFACPACGHTHRVDLSKVPPGGATGKCKRCGCPLVLHPDGSVTSQAPAFKAGEDGSAPSQWWVKQGEGELGPFGPQDMADLAASGGLPADRMVKRWGGEWAPASSYPALAPLLVKQPRGGGAPAGEPSPEEPLGSPDACYAHPETGAVRVCTACHRHLCEACLKTMGGASNVKPVLACGACGGPTMALKKRERWTPFHKDMVQVLGSPFQGHALFYFAFLSFLEVLKVPCRFAPMVGLAAIFILVCLQYTFYIHLVREVANGSYTFPEWPETNNFMDMVMVFLKVLVVALVSVVPALLLACLGGAGLVGMAGLSGRAGIGGAMAAAALPILVATALIFLFYLTYLPICVAIVAIFNTVLPALNPVLIIRIIFRLGAPYFTAVLLWAAFIVIEGGIGWVLGHVPVLGAVVAAPFSVYFTLVSAYVLGRVCYENEEKIGWY